MAGRHPAGSPHARRTQGLAGRDLPVRTAAVVPPRNRNRTDAAVPIAYA